MKRSFLAIILAGAWVGGFNRSAVADFKLPEVPVDDLLAVGLRNEFDVGFNSVGELFTYDARHAIYR